MKKFTYDARQHNPVIALIVITVVMLTAISFGPQKTEGEMNGNNPKPVVVGERGDYEIVATKDRKFALEHALVLFIDNDGRMESVKLMAGNKTMPETSRGYFLVFKRTEK